MTIRATTKECYDKAIDYLDEELGTGNPVMVGVDYKSGHTGNYDKITDHLGDNNCSQKRRTGDILYLWVLLKTPYFSPFYYRAFFLKIL
jgi:hypothetical protein